MSTVEMVKRKQLITGGYNYHGDSYQNRFGLRWGVYMHIYIYYVYNIDKYEHIHSIYIYIRNNLQ